MSPYSHFLEEEKHLMMSLPYRVGIWVSRCDDIERTTRDEQKEEQALETVLRALSRPGSQKPFVRRIAEDALQSKELWPVWRAQESRLLEDVEAAMRLSRRTWPAENVVSFGRSLLYVAHVVAHAYGEHKVEGEHIPEGLIFQWMERLAGPKINLDDPDNVSAREKAAIQKLAIALKT